MNLFTTNDFPARWNCGTWYDWHGWLHIISDTLIWAAYMAIPIALIVFIRRRDERHLPKIGLLFAAFIFSCGTGHLIEAVIFWHPAYYLAGAVKALTAIISWATVIALIKYMPTLLSIPSTLEAHKKLTVTLNETDRSNKMLSDFSAACAHHLKEPLRGIHNYSEIVLKSAKQQLGQKEVEKLTTMSSLVQRLDSLLTAMLRFSEIHEWQALKRQEDLHALATRAGDSVALELEQVRGKVLMPEPLPIAFCDRVLTQQLFSTIFLYAISRARRNKDLTITIECARDRCTPFDGLNDKNIIAIRDDGKGLSAEELDTALNLFGHSIDQNLAEQQYATFLGPSFAKILAETQEEVLWIESSLGGCTTVFVSFSAQPLIEKNSVSANEQSAKSYSTC